MTDSTRTRIGIDWGTSNRRAYVLDGAGRLARKHEDGAGILQVNNDFEGALRSLLQHLQTGPADVIISGMAGSRNGWKEVPYLGVEHPVSQLPLALYDVAMTLPDVRCRIVPGYRFAGASGLPDVMRGEETQVLGALHAGASGEWFLLPGTHSKWVRVVDGTIRELATFMTGELFALLSQHGTLAKVMDGQEAVPEAFAAGLEASAHGGFTHTAFCCRALVVTDAMPASHTASFLSGLLIGSELHDILRMNKGAMTSAVQVIGSAVLAERYLLALNLLGIESCAWQPDDVYVAALRALFNMHE